MRFTESLPATTSSRDDTARGSLVVAAMLGGPESAVLQIGDWFARDGFPGRVVSKDVSNPDQIEYVYSMETEAV